MLKNFNRRRGLQALVTVAAGVLAAPVLARDDCAVFARETQAVVTPDAALKYDGLPSSKDKALVLRVAGRNMRDVIVRLASAPVLAARIKAGQLKLAGAMHDVAMGKIAWAV